MSGSWAREWIRDSSAVAVEIEWFGRWVGGAWSWGSVEEEVERLCLCFFWVPMVG